MSEECLLCRLEDLPEGEARGFDPDCTGWDTVFVVRREGRLYAYLNSCPHSPGSRMSWRRHGYLSADRTRIVCAGHGSQFDIATGECLQGAAEGFSLQSLPLRVDEAGAVFLTSKEMPT